MRRILGIAGAMLILLVMLVPVALAADELEPTGRVLFSAGGDVTLPAGEQADTVIVIDGTAIVGGEVDTVVALNGRIEMTGARAETVVAITSTVELGAGTVVQGDVLRLDSTVTPTSGAVIEGQIRDVTSEIAGFGFVFAPVMMLFVVGFALAAIVAGLALAALAARQVRAAETIITREPLLSAAVGIGGLILPMLLVVALMITVVGAPLGFAILVGVWPLAAFVGYLVAAIWIGDWLLVRTAPDTTRERPYLAAVIGVVILQVASVLPFLPAIATVFGLGAVIVLAWRIFRGHRPETTPVHRAAPAPMAG